MSAALEKAFSRGKVIVHNKTSGEVMVRVTRPDKKKPGKAAFIGLTVPPNQNRNLTLDATVEELRRSPTLRSMTSPPTNILDVIEE